MPTVKYPKPIRRFPCTVPLSDESYLEARHRQEQLVELARKVANMKSCLDTGPPRTHVSVKLKLKKLMEEGLKLAELEFNNRLMLKRIIRAMNAPATTDNHLNIRNRPTSLNFGARMLEADRINAANFRTLTRILQVKPCYDRIKQEQSYRHLTKDRKSRKDVFKLWNKLAEERKLEIMEGGEAATRYGHEDPDIVRARCARLHRNCFPEYFQYESFYTPVPPFCRSDPDAKKIDHSRCLRDDREMFQQFPSIRRTPNQINSPPQYQFATTRTTRLRAKEVKKRAKQWRLITFGTQDEYTKGRYAEAYTTFEKPDENVVVEVESHKHKKDRNSEDDPLQKHTENRGSSIVSRFGVEKKKKDRNSEDNPSKNRGSSILSQVGVENHKHKKKKDRNSEDNPSQKHSENRSASAVSPYPPPAVTHTCDPFVGEHSNFPPRKVSPGPESLNVSAAKKESSMLPSAARPRAQPDKSPQTGIGTVEVKGCVTEHRAAEKDSSFLARMCRDTSSSEGDFDETIIASEDITSRPTSREYQSASSEGTDSEERVLPLSKPAEEGRKGMVVTSDENASKASKSQGLASSSARYSTSWTTDEESAGPRAARKEKDGTKRSVKTKRGSTPSSRQKGKEVSIGASSRTERSHAVLNDNTSEDGEELPLSSWVSSPALSSSTSMVSGRQAPQHSDKEYVEDFTSSSQYSSHRSDVMESEGEASSKHPQRQE